MDAATLKNRFSEFNLDPALAEMAEAAPGQQIIEAIVRLEDPDQIPPHFTVVSRFKRICTGRFAAAHTWTIRRHPNVVSLKAARPLGIHDEGGNPADLVPAQVIRTSRRSSAPFAGRGCIVAALDFGLDFAHPNFLNPDGTTRLVDFWHQGAPYDPAHPNRFGYGRIFSQQEINAALRASDPYQALGYHPAISDAGGDGSHGTHTMDIAAGNGRAHGAEPGAAANADLIFVHLSTPRLSAAGDLGDSVRLLEALDAVNRMARGRPWVVNLSVGRTAGSHDGTSLVEQGMQELLRLGLDRAICQSCGNYRTADLAVEGWLRDGEYRDLEWIIDPADTTANEIDAWYSGRDRFVVGIRPPQGSAFTDVKLGEVSDIVQEGALIGRIYHRKDDPKNRDNHIEAFLYPGAPPGVWTVRLSGDYVISGRFHAWIERDMARPGAQSRFDRRITSQSYTLGTIATSPLVITVGAYDANAEERPLAPFSSCGPTRDERHSKPELLAPGVGEVAARSIPRGAVQQEGLLVARSGTSMASPHVAGAVCAMFEAAGRPVSIDEIRDCLMRSAEPVADSEHPDCCAWGRLDAAGAIRRISNLKEPDRSSAPRGYAFTPGALAMTSELAVSDAVAGEFSNTSRDQETGASVDEGVLTHMDQIESYDNNPPAPFEDEPYSTSGIEVLNIDPDSGERESDRVEAVQHMEAESGTRPLRVRARILWPALGFPAVISPRSNGSTDALETRPSRSIVALIISDQRHLGKEDAAHYLRIVPWSQRGRRHIPDGQQGSFRVEDVQVRNDDRGKILQWPQSDTHGQAVVFGGGLKQGQDPDDDVVVVSLSRMVLDFYRKQGLEHLHEIRISEAAAARLTGDQYHLFWNNDVENPSVPSGEMQLLLDNFAKPNRTDLAPEWRKHLEFFLDEYKYDYGALHPPYQSLDRQNRLTEVLHPVFIRRWSKPLNIAHITDTHLDVRADVYEENLAKEGKLAGISFNNYNKDFCEIYRESRANADLILLTGDLIDYGRGHVGLSFNGRYRQTLGQDGAYHRDRNWMLFYYLLASGGNYTKPAFTCLGNHDWRLNPYPPFAPGTPDPESLVHNADDFRKQPGVLKELIKVAHGPGHQKGFAYTLDAESKLGLLFKEPMAALRGLGNKLDTDGSPVQTKVESVAWYLMLINPFLDYSVKLPSGQRLLMLDWAEDEEVMNFDEPKSFMEFGQRAAKSLTALQKWHVDEFARQPGKAKIIGIHAPPIGPSFLWEDSDLLKGVKKYARSENSLMYDANWQRVRMTEHTLFAIRPKTAPRGIEAAYGSFDQARDWFIRRVADPAAGVRLVLSGHIHRNGLLVVRTPAVEPKVWIIRGVNYNRARGALPPRVGSSEPDANGQAITYFGPLYVNTTSGGPRGHKYQGGHKYVSPGYAIITLASDGTIANVSVRQIVPAAPSPRRTPVVDVCTPDAPATTSEPATEDFSIASMEQEAEALVDEGVLVNSDATDRFLDRAEQALVSSPGGRRESETAFLQRLLRELDSQVSARSLSPAQLLRAVLSNQPSMGGTRDMLDVLSMPSQRPETALRRGDWMLRAVPGTGDVGHVAVLASDDLVVQPMLAPEGITAESAQPGHYGSVIEAGAFPHSRSRPFARRWLDERGRVPPHTVVLRPRYADPETPADYPDDKEGEYPNAGAIPEIGETPDEAEDFGSGDLGEDEPDLKLAIEAGSRDENELTNLIFFARHPELPVGKLDPKDQHFERLSNEWSSIRDHEVWRAIQASAVNTDLVVSGDEVTDHHRRFFRGKSGKRLKTLVENAAREVDLNPGLLGTIMMAETRRPQSYLTSEKVSSYHIGADDFFEARAAIQARVPAYSKVKWDKKQKPLEHLNDAKTDRRVVKTILFDSGPDAVLATAVYLKFREVRLREIAAELGGDFDSLPLATRMALTRMAMAAGTGGATRFLKQALKGGDIFVRKAIPVAAYQTQRNATVRTAQAMHLSDWVFGIRVPAAAKQPAAEAIGDSESTESSAAEWPPGLPAAAKQPGPATVIDPFPAPYPLALNLGNASFNACADAASADPDVAHLCGALVDLTGKPASPSYRGHNHDDMLYVGSLAKIYPIYAAYELMHRVEIEAKKLIKAGLPTNTAGWQNRIFAELKKAWGPRLDAAFPPPLPSGFPRLPDIFQILPSGDVHLSERSPPLTDAELDAIGEFGAPKGKFRDWMRLMLRWSNNSAASKCILALSFPYINGVFGSGGFFDKTTRNGLWVSGDYLGHDWLSGGRAGQPLTPRWAKLQKRSVTNFAGTACQVARLLTLIAQGKLIDGYSSIDMISIMQGANGIGSYIQSAFTGAVPPRPFSSISSKIGYGNDRFSHDCAIVRVDRGDDPARALRFVTVILGSPPDRGRADLTKLAVAHYDCVRSRHP